MAAAVNLGGLAVGLDRPLALLALPVAVGLLWALVLRRSAPSETGRRVRVALFATRLAVVALLVTAAAAPYTVETRETPGEPRVTLLVDRSDSMAVEPAVADRLADAIEAQGVPVETATIATGTSSRIGDGIIANLERDGSLVVVTDGQMTDGRSLAEAAEVARGVNATVNAVRLSPTAEERLVRVSGPGKTSVGVENAFLATVEGVNIEDTAAQLTVEIDGVPVASRPVEGPGTLQVSHRFSETGTHRIVAWLEGDDVIDANDVFYKTVRVVPRPRILYVARGSYPFESFLRQLYQVTRAESVPADLDPYAAVVIQDVAAEDVGDIEALQRYVISGNGLLVVGGENAYENGDYGTSPIASMLPVRTGDQSGRSARIALLVDVSGSTEEGMRTQKALALDVLSQLGDENQVGLVAFNYQAYRVADLRPLATARADLEDRIRRLQAGGATSIAVGLRGAEDLLGERGGTIIMITDGWDRSDEPESVARSIGAGGTRIIAIGVGKQINAVGLRRIAAAAGGTFLRADETSRLRILFGGPNRQYAGSGLTVLDEGHFITAGVQPRSNPGRSNDVAAKEGASFLVSDASGTPALTAWRFGLGRVVSITAYGADGTLDGLLAQPDSLLLTKSVNWVIGDPERTATGVVDLADTRVGDPTTVVYRGQDRPSADDLRFVRTADGTFRATVTPTEAGFHPVLDAAYAASYPREYGAVGPAPALEEAVAATGGRTFAPSDAAGVASFVRRQQSRVREVRSEWDWLLLAAALLLYLLEVAGRRLYGYRGGTVP